jgi:hypothetical protein
MIFDESLMLSVVTQFLTHLFDKFFGKSKIAKNNENPKNMFLIYLHRF